VNNYSLSEGWYDAISPEALITDLWIVLMPAAQSVMQGTAIYFRFLVLLYLASNTTLDYHFQTTTHRLQGETDERWPFACLERKVSYDSERHSWLKSLFSSRPVDKVER